MTHEAIEQGMPNWRSGSVVESPALLVFGDAEILPGGLLQRPAAIMLSQA
ncbi:hypothetical protein [Rhizobium lentis]|nr:hypothetical protein [Rhizobium lentis]MBX5148808.1 hypothetical protein [Rhizobium lentis]